jgi:hypothetical protein
MVTGNQSLQANVYAVKPLPMGYNTADPGLIDDLQFRNLVRERHSGPPPPPPECSLLSSQPNYFMAREESDYCARSCFGPKRGFLMHVQDGTGMDVMRINRPFKCNLPLCYPMCGCVLCPEEAEVFSMAPGGFQGPLLAKIRIAPGFSCSLEETYHILGANNELVYIVTSNICQMGPNMCCQQYSFDILEPNGAHTGAYIKNLWPGCNGRLFSKADNLCAPGARTLPPISRRSRAQYVHVPADCHGGAPGGHLCVHALF